jgi:hypothetical protein
MRRFLEVVMVTGIIATAIALSGGYFLFAVCSLMVAALAAGRRKWCAWKEMEMHCAASSGPGDGSGSYANADADCGDTTCCDPD